MPGLPPSPPGGDPLRAGADGAAPRTTAIVLAAGLGTRMRSRLPKVLHPVCGRPMLAYVLEAARSASGGARPLVVTSPATSAVREAFADEADFSLQAVPRGTADAVRSALVAVSATTREVLVLSGDVPLVDPALVVELAEARRANGAAMALVVLEADEPGRLGRVVRDADGVVSRVVEARDATPQELDIGEVNVGLYAFDADWLRGRIEAVRPSPASGELYLPELVAMARAEGVPVAAVVVEDDGTLLGINDRAELADAEVEMRLRINERHMRAGVTIVDPATAYVDDTVELAEDVMLEPFVVLRGATRVGRDTLVRAGSQLVDATVGERCVVWASVLESCVLEDDVRVGPYSHLRMGAHLAAGVEVGNFAEVKNSRLGRATKSHHVSYLGDADIGERVNIGAGTITANFDGRRKHRTRIGDGAFIGTDTVLRAPVTIGRDAMTGAGSVVTHDVPDGALVVGVPARERPPRPADDRRRPPASADDREPGSRPADGREADEGLAAGTPSAPPTEPAAEAAAGR